jgi:hypothetical protein
MVNADVTIASEEALLHLLVIDPLGEVVDVSVEKVSINVRFEACKLAVSNTIIVATGIALFEAIIIAFFIERTLRSQGFGFSQGTVATREFPRALVADYRTILVVESAVPF